MIKIGKYVYHTLIQHPRTKFWAIVRFTEGLQKNIFAVLTETGFQKVISEKQLKLGFFPNVTLFYETSKKAKEQLKKVSEDFERKTRKKIMQKRRRGK